MNDTITYKQFKCIFTLAFLALNFLTYASRLTNACLTDGILPILITSVIAYAGACAIIKVMLSHKGMDFRQILTLLWGKVFGNIVFGIFVLNLFHFSWYAIRLLSEQIGVCMLRNVSVVMIELILILTVLFIGIKRLRTLGNLSQILIWYAGINLLLLLLLTSKAAEIKNMLPLFTSGLPEYTRGVLVTSSYLFSAVLALPFFIPKVEGIYGKNKVIYKDMLIIFAAVFAVYCAFYVMCISVLGTEFTIDYVFPALRIVQSDNSHNAFFERFEIMLLSSVIVMHIMYFSVTLRSVKTAAESVFNEKNAKIAFFLSPVIVFAVVLFFKNQAIGKIIFQSVDASNITAPHALLPFIVYIGYLLKKRKMKNE